MKSLMISLSPYEWEKLVQGEKSSIMRNEAVTTPFKCYVYETQGKRYSWNVRVDTIVNNAEDRYLDCKRGMPDIKRDSHGTPYISYGRMAVVGEFVCNDASLEKLNQDGGLVRSLWEWNVKEIKVYDKPLPLSQFVIPCKEWGKGEFTPKCCHCRHYVRNDSDMCAECDVEGEIKVTQPPKKHYSVLEIT